MVPLLAGGCWDRCVRSRYPFVSRSGRLNPSRGPVAPGSIIDPESSSGGLHYTGCIMSRRAILHRIPIPVLALAAWATACGGGGDVASPVHPQFAPFRHGASGSLGYAALHFTEIYGDRHPVAMHPVYPSLGYPVMTWPGVGLLDAQYLGLCDGVQDAIENLEIALTTTPFTPLSIDLAASRVHRVGYDRTTSRAVCGVNVAVRIPDSVAPGFYGLAHQMPSVGQDVLTTPDAAPVSIETPRAVVIRSTDPSLASDFSFVHLSDLHQRPSKWGAIRYKDFLPLDMMPEAVMPNTRPEHLPNLRALRVVHMINQLRPRPDVVVLTGDIVDHGDEAWMFRAAHAILARLEVPIFLLPGNHDYAHKDSIEPDDPELSRGDLGLMHYMQHFHPFLAPRFQLGGYRWLGLDTGLAATTQDITRLAFITTTGITRGQLADIERFFATDSPRGHILFGHTPTRTSVTGWTPGGRVGRSGAFNQGSQALELLLLDSARRGKHVVYLNGHVHWNDVFRVPDRDVESPYRLQRRRPVKQAGLPCFADVPISQSPVLISTQSATKPQRIELDWTDPGIEPGEDPGNGFGFRLIRVSDAGWQSAIYRFSGVRETVGLIADGAEQVDALRACD